MMQRVLASLLLVSTAFPVSAQTIYKCVDANGSTLISTSRSGKDCKAISSSSGSSMSAPQRASTGKSASATPSPASFPRVMEDTQKSRDLDRRHILEQELSGEQRSLDQARKDLAAQQGVAATPDRLASSQEKIGRHERNIQAIEIELSKLR